MSTRFTLFLAGAASLPLATPAFAHDDPVIRAEHVEIVEAAGHHDGVWRGHWTGDDAWRGTWGGQYTTRSGEVLDGEYVGTFIGEGRFVTDGGRVLAMGNSGWRQHGDGYEVRAERHHTNFRGSPDGRSGYSVAEREAWLSDCRLLMADQGGYDRYDERDDDFGGSLLGGLLGTVVGGFAGNRIDDDGSRLAGTLIGAGLGGVAGAVIGAAIDSADDDRYESAVFDPNELWAARYCDAYLRRYELGGGTEFANPMSYGQPVTVVRNAGGTAGHGRHGHRHGAQCTTTVREEWIELESPEPAARPARRVIQRPQPSGKTVPVQ